MILPLLKTGKANHAATQKEPNSDQEKSHYLLASLYRRKQQREGARFCGTCVVGSGFSMKGWLANAGRSMGEILQAGTKQISEAPSASEIGSINLQWLNLC